MIRHWTRLLVEEAPSFCTFPFLGAAQLAFEFLGILWRIARRAAALLLFVRRFQVFSSLIILSSNCGEREITSTCRFNQNLRRVCSELLRDYSSPMGSRIYQSVLVQKQRLCDLRG